MSEKRTFIRRTAGTLLTALTALTAMAASWTWTAGGANDNWTTCGNWSSTSGLPPECYPSEDNDDVVFPINGGGWDVILTADETMDDLTVLASIDLPFNQETRTLTVDSLSIGQFDAGTGEIVINVAYGVTLKSP